MPLMRITELEGSNSFRVHPLDGDTIRHLNVGIEDRDRVKEIIEALSRGETVIQRFRPDDIGGFYPEEEPGPDSEDDFW